VLREDHLSVELDVEDAIIALDQARLYGELLLNLGRQTGGLRQVVSAYAVFDRDFHRISSAVPTF
jgi:hypothetical protein